MALIVRTLVILLACVVASLAGGAVLTAAALLPAWSNLMLDPFAPGVVGYLFAFGALFLSFFALLPWLLLVIVSESLAIRSALFYAAAGAGISCLLYLQSTQWDTLALTVDGFARRELELMAAAGIVAGFIYWAIAGRNAGAWRAPPPSVPGR
ncbi:MAG: hypothetical protein IT538_03075 [Variibacter sp.]|nr:hypothetical protein [Variibacter sp.]